MTRNRLTFRHSDIVRAIKAVEAAGHTVARVEIGPDGRIIVDVDRPNAEEQPSPLDQWLKKHAHEVEGD